MSESLPLFESILITGSVQNVFVVTPVGPVGIAGLGFDMGMNGIVADGMLREVFKVDGLMLPAGILPAWAIDLVPKSFGLAIEVEDFGLAAPAKILLETRDLSRTTPPTREEDAKLLKALVPKGALVVSIGPSKISAKLFDLDYEASLTAGPYGTAAGAATIKATGFDRAVDALKAPPAEMLGQATPALIAARGMAKTESDGFLSWRIEGILTGRILVNGMDVTKMGVKN